MTGTQQMFISFPFFLRLWIMSTSLWNVIFNIGIEYKRSSHIKPKRESEKKKNFKHQFLFTVPVAPFSSFHSLFCKLSFLEIGPEKIRQFGGERVGRRHLELEVLFCAHAGREAWCASWHLTGVFKIIFLNRVGNKSKRQNILLI